MAVGRRQYPFHLIEPKWQAFWDRQQTFRAWNPGEVLPHGHPFAKRHNLEDKKASAAELPPKNYILDMFPYPSGAGLHVGHPEGYTATDILARYRRALGYNVLHPMGWDAFGLPAEQYAIKTGQHPRKTTEENIATFKRQIKSLGFSYDWTREVDTTDPNYFKWSQWIFLKLYNSWFNPETNKAEPIETLAYPQDFSEWLKHKENIRSIGEQRGDSQLKDVASFSNDLLEMVKRQFRDSKRLAYVTDAPVWWCEQLGTVLANEEVVDGKSEVGGFPVVRKPMRQWMLKITEYAERLLSDLESIDWSHSLKEMQRNRIGRSDGAEVDFQVVGHPEKIRVFTTRPDTLFGATYMVLSPEHTLVEKLTTREQKAAVDSYRQEIAGKSDRERTDASKDKTGVFTGACAVNPVNQEQIPIWIADYVLATYGTGAIMAVPAHDERDWEFAKKFDLPIEQVVREKAEHQPGGGVIPPLESPFCDEGIAMGSPSDGWGLKRKAGEPRIVPPDINGLFTPEAKKKITIWLEEKGLGKKTINYKLRDWLFSRQRYWGEPFPIVWKKDPSGAAQHEAVSESALPVLPPKLDDYKPTPDGQPPLARAKDWVNLPDGSQRETNTMPQWAGSCWYYLRYLDAQNGSQFVGKGAEEYWMGSTSPKSNVQSPKSGEGKPGVDLYVGGTEHAVLHLLYARFWHKVLFDLGYVSTPEPFFKLVNQGLILGEDGQKMAKSKGNVINPDDMVRDFGADALRLYEMFMGPLEMVKPWSTKGVEGVYRFLGRVWRLFVDEASETAFEQAETTSKPGEAGDLLNLIKLSPAVQGVDPSPEQLKVLHACIKKVTDDLEGMRFNTAISALMVFTNDATAWQTRPVSVMKTFLQLLAPFAPHLAEELWELLSNGAPARAPGPTPKIGDGPESLTYAPWPKYDPALLVEDTLEIPVQVNGKLRDRILIPAKATKEEMEAAALASPKVKAFIEGKTIKKIIVVPNKLVNIAIA